MEGEIRRSAGQRRPEAQTFRRGDCPAEAGRRGSHLGQRGTPGPARKKVVEPAAQKAAADYLIKEHQMSERRACRLLDLPRAPPPYRPKRKHGDTLRRRWSEWARQRQRFGY